MLRSTNPLFALLLFSLLLRPDVSEITDREVFTAADGLPSEQVLSLAQSSDGTLWAGTDFGLRYYFAGAFRPDPEAPALVNGETIHALLAAPDGTLFTGSGNGLFTRTIHGEWMQGPAHLSQGAVHAIASDSTGSVWAGGRQGLVRIDRDQVHVVQVDGADPVVTALAPGASGSLWAAVETADGTRLLRFENGSLSGRIGPEGGFPSGAGVLALAVDDAGNVWAGTNIGLYRTDPEGSVTAYGPDQGLKSSVIPALLYAPGTGLLVGTSFGLDYLNRDGSPLPLPWPVVVTGPSVQALLSDDEGGLWLGTNRGLVRTNHTRWQEVHDPLVTGRTIPAIGFAPDETPYVLTSEDLLRRPGTAWDTVPAPDDTGRMFALSFDADGLPLLGAEGGLYILSGGALAPHPEYDLARPVSALHHKGGTLWIGTDLGLYALNADGLQFQPEIGETGITAVWESPGGELWAAGANRGAFLLDDGRWTPITLESSGGGLISDFVLAGAVDPTGDRWFGTLLGPVQLSADGSPADPNSWLLPQDYGGGRVNAVLVGRPGYAWLASEGGLYLTDGFESSHFQVGSDLDNHPVRSLAHGPDGALWIGTDHGLFLYRDAGISPRLALAEVRIDNEPCGPDCRQNSLPYRVSAATFALEAADLGDPGGIRYRLLLVERSGETVRTSLSRLQAEPAFTLDLAPGIEYEISFQAVDRSFNLSESTEPVRLTVAAPTWWDVIRDHPLFPLFTIVGVTAGAAGLVAGRRAWINRTPRKYRDLSIALFPGAAGEFRLRYRLEGENEGQPLDTRLDLPWLHTSQERIERKRVSESALRDVGGALYDALFPERSLEEIAGKFAYRGLRPVRIRLQLDAAPDLSRLPWELARDPAIGFLGTQVDTPLLRAAAGEVEDETRPLTGKLRILAVFAQPDHPDLPPLNLKSEVETLESIDAGSRQLEIRCLAGALAAGQTGLRAENSTLFDAVAETLEGGDAWDVVHFACHAGRERLPWGDLGGMALGLEDAEGRYLPVGADNLNPLFEALRTAGRAPRLVVLNACRTARSAAGLSSIFLEGGIGSVLGMQWPVRDAAAGAFTRGFYNSLARHGQMDLAVNAGRGRIARTQGEDERDWAAPVLYSKHADGFLFRRI